MAAELEDAPRGRGPLRFRRPAWDQGTPLTFAPPPEDRPTFARTRRAPAGLLPYLRGAAHWAAVIAAVEKRVGASGEARAYSGDCLACGQTLLRALADPTGDRDGLITDLTLLLFPPTACPQCGAAYLRETARRAYCCNRCRKAVEARAQKRRFTERACARCAAPLTRKQKTYCSLRCSVAALRKKETGDGHAI
jgi:endogenous inhibitor of DNA gyrase (YacG/DUF329 family)